MVSRYTICIQSVCAHFATHHISANFILFVVLIEGILLSVS